MADTYSTYEAKAKFSEIMRKIREGKHVIVTYRGREVAEIKPVANEETFEERLEKLRKRGAIVDAIDPNAPLEPIARRPGALKRFLEDRD
jgi:prevent-host-death family protein